MRNKTRSSNTFPQPLPSSWAQLHSHFSTSSPQSGTRREMVVTVSSPHVVSAAPSSSGRRLPHTLPLLQHEIPLMGDSSPQTSPP